MTTTNILAGVGAVAVIAVAVKIDDALQTRRKKIAAERRFQAGWKTFLEVHHDTGDFDLAMRTADKVQALFD